LESWSREALLQAGRRLVGMPLGSDEALAKSGVRFRTLMNDDGTLERWQPPRLRKWPSSCLQFL
jgi:hypothetical protein